jgi:protein O-GlcNAc transferase
VLRRAIAAHQAGNLSEAESCYRAFLSIHKDQFDALHMLGVLEGQRGHLDEALRLVKRALKINSQSAEAYTNLARIQHQMNQHEAALISCNKALSISPNFALALNIRAGILHSLKRFEQALRDYDEATAIAPNFAEAIFNRGNILFELGRSAAALENYDRALQINPDFVSAWIARGNIFRGQGLLEESLAAYNRALAIRPESADAYLSRGILLFDLRRLEDALADFDKALILAPNLVAAWNGRGTVLLSLNRGEEALTAFLRALAIKSDLAEAWVGCGNVYLEARQLDAAMTAYDNAIAIKPNMPEAWSGRGHTLLLLRRFADAVTAYDKALASKPDLKSVKGIRLYAKMAASDWSNFYEESAALISDINEGILVSDPFYMLTIPSSPADQLKCAELHVRHAYPATTKPLWRGERYSHGRIRLAYLSADLHDHATAHLMAGLFECHDRSRFESIALSFGPRHESNMRQRLMRSFDRFIDVRGQSDQAIAELLRTSEIDIAVDLKGFTLDARPRILAKRAAPIQVSYLGYPGTMGASYIDYLIADRYVIPDYQRGSYSEKLVYLPESYQVNDDRRQISDIMPSRATVGLPEDGFVFCCFNSSYKITPNVFDAWMRLLRGVDGSVLWLFEANSEVPGNLRREAEARGVPAERLIFAPKVNSEDHLARHRLADLFLDTLPYNAHTTASDALRTGVPVLTCSGATFASRVAGSLLQAVGLPELITDSLADYEATALRLARSPSLLAGLKAKLARSRQSSSLFDTVRFTRHIEAAYAAMWERYRRGEPPMSFAVGESVNSLDSTNGCTLLPGH